MNASPISILLQHIFYPVPKHRPPATIPSIMSHRPGINAGPKIAPETDAHLLRCICRLVAQSGLSETICCLSAIGAKRTSDEAAAWSVPTLLPSRPGEFHPEPLTDPDLTLSRHPARATARRPPPSVGNWSSSCCQLARSQRR